MEKHDDIENNTIKSPKDAVIEVMSLLRLGEITISTPNNKIFKKLGI